ncbi:MAG: thioesterase family protein [Pseudomonadota bacterium]
MTFQYRTEVSSDWIDFNGHMRDAYYGLVFSYAMDDFLDHAGFTETYRETTGCTIYLMECHTFYLAEVHQGAPLTIECRVLDVDAKRFQMHLTMLSVGNVRAVNERLELHVNQRPEPHAELLPEDIRGRLEDMRMAPAEVEGLKHRSRRLGFKK